MIFGDDFVDDFGDDSVIIPVMISAIISTWFIHCKQVTQLNRFRIDQFFMTSRVFDDYRAVLGLRSFTELKERVPSDTWHLNALNMFSSV